MYSEGNIWSDLPTVLAAAHEMKSPLVLIRQLALELEDMGENSTANYRDWETDRKSTRLNSSHRSLSRMPSSA